MTRLKEALLILKGGKYNVSDPSDTKILDTFLDKDGDTKKFLEKLDVLYTEPNFVKFRKHLRCMKAFMALVGFLMVLYILFFIMSIFTNLSPGHSDTYEFLYLGFCGILIIFFTLILYMAYTEAKVFRACRLPILHRLKNMVGEEFPGCYFNLNIDRHLTIRARPSTASDTTAMDIENMDYYDYVNLHNPEDDDYYKGQNPYDFDPHEKNLMAEKVKQREKDLEKENKKKSKLKFIGASNKELH